MAKNCIVGKSCGASCVSRNHDCEEEFPPKVRKALDNLVVEIEKKVGSGELSADDANKVLEGAEESGERNLKKLADFFDSGRATEADKEGIAEVIMSAYVVTGQDRNASRTLSYEEAEAINKMLPALEKAEQASIGKDGKFDPSLPGGMGDYVASKRVREVSDEAAELAYSLLPQSVRSKWNKRGAVEAPNAFTGEDENGNPKFGAPNKERGVMLLKTWAEQGGIDPYTGAKVPLLASEPEHLFSFAKAAQTGVSGDQPKNLLMATSAANNLKSDLTIGEFRQKVGDILSMGRERYTKEVYEPAVAEAGARKGKKAQAPNDVEAAMAAVSPQERVQMVKGLINSYGKDSRYVVNAAGIGWQFNMQTPAHDRKPSRPRFMDDGAQMPGGGKPSQWSLVALAASNREQRAAIRERIESMRQNRAKMTPAELEEAKVSTSAGLAVQKRKDAAFAQELSTYLKEVVPNIEELV